MSAKVHLDREHMHDLLKAMIRIRHFETKCVELYEAQEILGFLHLYDGEEAVSVGVMQALGPADAVVATYREHGQALARGVPADAVMAEMLGKREGCCRGRGGSMHIFDRERRFYGGNAIVGGGLPLAIGVALADQTLGRPAVTACFFGDGAVDEGEFHETLNLAALWKLPVLFVCENNLYSMGMAIARAEAQTDIARKAAVYSLPSEQVDGMDVIAVEAAARRAVASIRERGGPYFLECKTYRLPRPFDVRRAALSAQGGGRGLARQGTDRPLPQVARGQSFHYRRRYRRDRAGGRRRDRRGRRLRRGGDARAARRSRTLRRDGGGSAMSEPAAAPLRMTYREACKQALRQALQADPRVLLMGEDIGRYGGCYAVTKGLIDEFGEQRIRDTPLSESAYVGAGIGAAMAGLRPIVEIMTVNFSMLALDQIVNNAATIPHMSGGQFAIPLVIRIATGGGRRVAAQHSHSLEGWYAHIPGLRILAPATVEDARFMLIAALKDPNPVLIFEHVMLYNLEGDLSPDVSEVDIAHAKVRRPGRDITLITYGGSLFKTLEAADDAGAGRRRRRGPRPAGSCGRSTPPRFSKAWPRRGNA